LEVVRGLAPGPLGKVSMENGVEMRGRVQVRKMLRRVLPSAARGSAGRRSLRTWPQGSASRAGTSCRSFRRARATATAERAEVARMGSAGRFEVNVARGIQVLALVVLGGACTSSLEEYRREVEKARACEPDDVCVLAGHGTRCACPVVVNEAHAQRIDELAQKVSCNHAVDCFLPCNPRCEDGRCVADYCACDPLESCPADAGVDAGQGDGGSTTVDAGTDSG
jgi:hypothetical protein